ncbi:MAG: hypothetical protein C4346_02375 [Chloroflexota bacterium]
MCLDCGCGQPHDDHGDPRHITLERLEQAAEASGISVTDVVHNLQEGVHTAQSQASAGTDGAR